MDSTRKVNDGLDKKLTITTTALAVSDGPPSAIMQDDSEPEWSYASREATERLFKKPMPPSLFNRLSTYVCGFFYTPRPPEPFDDFPEYADPASCSEPITPFYPLIDYSSSEPHNVVDNRLNKK